MYTDHGTLRVLHSTITANRAPDGGGIWDGGSPFGTDVEGSVVAGNTADGTTPNDVASFAPTNFRSLGYNVLGASGRAVDVTLAFNQPGDQTGITDPAVLGLGPLADNGGPTQTHAVLPGSAALDKGDPAFDPNAYTPPLTTDQRSPASRGS